MQSNLRFKESNFVAVKNMDSSYLENFFSSSERDTNEKIIISLTDLTKNIPENLSDSLKIEIDVFAAEEVIIHPCEKKHVKTNIYI